MEPIIDPKAQPGEVKVPTPEETRRQDHEWLNQEIVDSIPLPATTLESLEESQSRWRWTVGRNKALADPISSASMPSASSPVQAGQQVTSDMDMIDRVMLTHPGLTREQAQQQLDEAGY